MVLNCGLIPPGGVDNFGNGFLPASYQGSIFKAGDHPVANITPSPNQDAKRSLLKKLDEQVVERIGAHDAIEAAIANDELAARMQLAVPDLMEIGGESAATQSLYGLDDPYGPAQAFGRNCLTARRLVERGVRFVECSARPLVATVGISIPTSRKATRTTPARSIAESLVC